MMDTSLKNLALVHQQRLMSAMFCLIHVGCDEADRNIPLVILQLVSPDS